MLKKVLASALVLHGLAHITGFLAIWTDLPLGYSSRGSVFSSQLVIHSDAAKLLSVFWVLALAGFLATVYGLLTEKSWWHSLALLTSAVSLLAVIPWLSVAPMLIVFGLVAVDITVLALLSFRWGDYLLEALP